MCTAYRVGKHHPIEESITHQIIEAYLDWQARKQRQDEELEEYLVRPTNYAPVIMPDGKVEIMHWGFPLKIPGATEGRMLERTMVNAREDKLDGRTWRTHFALRRCIIPASGYYEWTGTPGSKQAHFFTRTDSATMWIAGIWTEHPERGNCYAMITTEPNRVAAFVHDRMPAVLRPEEIEPFLAGKMRQFRPAEETMRAEAVASPLSSPTGKPAQGELF